MSRFDIRLSLVAGAVALACNPAHADVITDWNITALAATEALSPQAEIRVLAMTHAAMFDAVNAITRSHGPFIAQPSAPAGSSVEAAAAGAAHGVLLGLLPGRKAALDDALNASSRRWRTKPLEIPAVPSAARWPRRSGPRAALTVPTASPNTRQAAAPVSGGLPRRATCRSRGHLG